MLSGLHLGVAAFAPAPANTTTTFETFETFETFARDFGKHYPSDAERELRHAYFDAFQARVNAQNEKFRKGESTWWAGLSKIADYSDAERAMLRGRRGDGPLTQVASLSFSPAANPSAVDWRAKGVVTPVKDQGGCGSCWAFASTETVESHYAIGAGKQLILAPQTYVNCAKNPTDCGGTGGCKGSIPELAFNYTSKQGIALEADLPYLGRDHACTPYTPAVTCDGYKKLRANDASALETALAQVGPVAVNVAAEPWEIYRGGIFEGGCEKGGDCDLDHVVQAVGYAAGYWIVRNSWGTDWGEDGFIRLTRANDAKLFTDKKPADGVACKPFPKDELVGGESGVLYDMSFPVGVKAA